MATAARVSLITAEELLERPDDDYKYELVDGELVRMSPTGAEHGGGDGHAEPCPA